MITHTTLLPFGLHGKAVMKSIVICSHFHSGISKRCRRPADIWCSIFIYWQTKHL